MFAIIVTGGKQYKVKEGDVVFVEKLEASEGEDVKFDTDRKSTRLNSSH